LRRYGSQIGDRQRGSRRKPEGIGETSRAEVVSDAWNKWPLSMEPQLATCPGNSRC
jgi:hypothetical protein